MPAIYLDHAATSFPKPPCVAAAMTEYLTHVGANINRGSYGAAQQAELVALRLRRRLCELFVCRKPLARRVVQKKACADYGDKKLPLLK